MKKVLLSLSVTLIIVLFASCSFSDSEYSKLAELVKTMNTQCPKYTNAGVLNSVKLDGKKVVFTMTVDEILVPIKLLKQESLQNIMKASVLVALRKEENGQLLVDLAIKEKCSLVYEIKGNETDETCRLVLDSEYMKKPLSELLKETIKDAQSWEDNSEIEDIMKEQNKRIEKYYEVKK